MTSADLIHRLTPYLPRVVVAVGVFLALWAAAAVVGRLATRFAEAGDSEREQALALLARTVKVALLVAGAISALGTLGVNVSALVAGLGLTGFALGFALKDALSNLLAGVLILLYRPFRRRDRITVSGFEGQVVDIDLRYTTLQAEGKRILIPNSLLFTNTIVVNEPAAPAR